MSATRDRSQKFAFVYSNLYRIYRNEKEKQVAAQSVPEDLLKGVDSGRVLKAASINARDNVSAVEIEKHVPPVLGGHAVGGHGVALESLKHNLHALNNLHERLRFMLKELEDLAKE